VPTTYKIVSNNPASRLTPYAEEIIVDYQCGFQCSRSSSDHIFCIHQILEEKWEYNEAVHQLFVDFKKAHDACRREVLYNILIEFGIPMKLVVLIKMRLNETCNRVRVGNHVSEHENCALLGYCTARSTNFFSMLCDDLSVPSCFGFLTPHNLLVLDNYIICHCIVLVDCVMNLIKTCIQACRIFKVCSIISVLFSTNCCLFHNIIAFFSNNTFFITYKVTFKNLPQVK